jgi:hypothetical protein
MSNAWLDVLSSPFCDEQTFCHDRMKLLMKLGTESLTLSIDLNQLSDHGVVGIFSPISSGNA